ncbi:MAG: hypothetical protein ACREFY_06590 [Acetobacteraceae bacterium]
MRVEQNAPPPGDAVEVVMNLGIEVMISLFGMPGCECIETSICIEMKP